MDPDGGNHGPNRKGCHREMEEVIRAYRSVQRIEEIWRKISKSRVTEIS
jgi:hypothetical protein